MRKGGVNGRGTPRSELFSGHRPGRKLHPGRPAAARDAAHPLPPDRRSGAGAGREAVSPQQSQHRSHRGWHDPQAPGAGASHPCGENQAGLPAPRRTAGGHHRHRQRRVSGHPLPDRLHRGLSPVSGNAGNLLDQIERGLLDLALLAEPIDIRKYDFVPTPVLEE